MKLSVRKQIQISCSSLNKFNLRNADKFGLLNRNLSPIEKLKTYDHEKKPGRVIDDTLSFLGVKRTDKIPQITTVVGSKERKRVHKEAALDQYFAEGSGDKKKVVIECSKPEFNHYAGMRYLKGKDNMPLVSQFWAKNKYKESWFRIKKMENANTSLWGSGERQWEKFLNIIHPKVYQNIVKLHRHPTSVQDQLLSEFLTCDHFFLAGETGSGKTLAYASIILSKLLEAKENGKRSKAVILVPSLLLKKQTKEKLVELSEGLDLKIIAPEKGDEYSNDDFDIVVASPGRAANFFKLLQTFDSVEFVVLDEADNLLDESFVSELANFLELVPVKHSATNSNSKSGARVIFASATCPGNLQDLAEGIVDGPKVRYLMSKHLHRIPLNITQLFIRVREMDKMDKLVDILQNDLKSIHNKTLVFCKDTNTAKYVSITLKNNGFENILLSSQEKNSLEKLQEDCRVIVSTDMASRGLDNSDISHIINYNFPRHLVDYIHRIGRVGRCGASRASQRVTSFVRERYEVNHVNKIETAVRLNRFLSGIETDVAGHLMDRGN